MNELEEGKISTLLVRYCLPAMAGSLVTALYSIVDQIFIGSAAGVYGNAASNVVWPLVTFLTALSLMCGVGVSACMNMAMGRQDTVSARRYTAGGISLMVLCGLLLSLGVLVFLKPLLYLCGCTDSVFPYASVYTRILAYGFVFSLISSAGPFILRADGVPGYALFCTVIGNVLNVLGDYILVFVLKKGIAGAAWSTVISELTGTVLVLAWLPRMKTMRLEKNDFMLRPLYLRNIASAGMGPAMNFLTQTLSFILINGALKTYGSASVYGSENVLAAAGVAGMEAARTAARRGYEVCLFEKTGRLGGHIIEAGTHPFKKEVARLNEWYQRELRDLGVKVFMEKEATADDIKAMNADAVIIATGSVTSMPPIPGLEKTITALEASTIPKSSAVRSSLPAADLSDAKSPMTKCRRARTSPLSKPLAISWQPVPRRLCSIS